MKKARCFREDRAKFSKESGFKRLIKQVIIGSDDKLISKAQDFNPVSFKLCPFI